ncbi:hypothetical protein Droror1_Dr00007403 [Drosera rotundifolia]
MKETSKVIMGATLVMVLSLAIVLCLVLVLLAELYCSVLLRRRQLRTMPKGSVTAANSAEAVEAPVAHGQDRPPMSSASPLSSFIYQGVLDAPRSFLFPKLPSRREQRRREPDDVENQCSRFRRFLGVESSPGSNPSPCQPSILSSPSSPYVTVGELGPSAPALVPEDVAVMTGGVREVGSRRRKEELVVYISNPVYDRNPNGRSKRIDDTPFETPDTSPSRLETDVSPGEDEDKAMQVEKSPCSPEVISTPPLSPMKELPANACSVSLGTAGSPGSTGCESNSQNDASSSTLGTPCTSPSW